MRLVKYEKRKIIWTQHSKMKLKQYRFSEKGVLRIFRKPDRIEDYPLLGVFGFIGGL